MSIRVNFDQLPPQDFRPPGWHYEDLVTRIGAQIAADYWEEAGEIERAEWLRLWAKLAPDEEETVRRRGTSAILGWRSSVGFAKRRRAKVERAAARRNPDTEHGYGFREIW